MGFPYKTAEQFIYTEIVYHDAGGNEVAREALMDDAWYDTAWREDMTDEEIEDFIGADAVPKP